jgi:N6-L-threonylcarbamoyladenine synthase
MANKDIYILGIESSCDDTSAAVFRNNILLSNEVASQNVHKEYGGVVPELASRAHQKNIIPVVDLAIKRAGVNSEDINTVAFTRGPACWEVCWSELLPPKALRSQKEFP